jgi:PAS domain S-box-containing protein
VQHVAKRGVTEFLQVFQDVGATFFDLETDVLVVLDDRGNIERTNPAFARVLGYTEHDVFGCGLVQFVTVDDLAKFIKAFNWVPRPESFRMLHRGGGVINMKLVAARFRNRKGYLVLRQV